MERDISVLPRRWMVAYLLVRAVLVTALGLLLLMRPSDTVRTIARITGAFLALTGAIDLIAAGVRRVPGAVRRLLVLRGVVTIGIGALVYLLTDATITVVAILLGTQLVVGGGVSMLMGFWSRSRVRGWFGIAARGGFAALVGVVAILWPDKSVVAVAVLFGIQWIVTGLTTTVVAVALSGREAPARA